MFKNIFARTGSMGGELALIFGVGYLYWPYQMNLTIDSVLIENCTFEKGGAFIALYGENIILSNLTIKTIGTQDMYVAPLFYGFENSTYPISSYSFFNATFTLKYNQEVSL